MAAVDSLTLSVVRAWNDSGVGRIQLNDPDHRNVLSPRCSDEIALAVDALLTDAVAAIVLTAAAPVFCSGGSLDALLSRDVPLSASYRGQLALAESPVPTIAVVDGPAIGAGVNLPLACDVILTSPEARFDPRFIDVGIHPGGGHFWRLTQRVGRQGAAALVLLGDVLDGEAAAATGLAWRCLPADELEAAAMMMARRATSRSRPLMTRSKQTLRDTAGLIEVEAATAIELTAQEWSIQQPEFAATVTQIKQQLASRNSVRPPIEVLASQQRQPDPRSGRDDPRR